ncbi:MAG: PAS domain S-box protein [Dehalococcoidia bacterium]|nr:PAS domain S-box protein [Dehalococcoidia bacterium]
MIRYVAMHRRGGPLHALDEKPSARGRRVEKKQGHSPRAGSARRQVRSRPKKNVLRGRESLYRLLAENVSDVIWVSDLKANLVYISPSVERQIGYSAEEIMSHPLTVTTKRHLRQAIQKALSYVDPDRHRKGNSARPFRMAVTRKNGAVVWTETYMSVLKDQKGQPVGIVGAVRDITERKTYEQALENSESQLRLLSQRVLQVQEDERARIARDLHDQLGQELVYLRIKAQSLVEQAGSSSNANEAMMELVDLIDRARSTSHRIAESVSPPILDDMGLVRAVRLCAAEFSRHSSIPCYVDVDTGNLCVPMELATAAYRILQEALTNISKHAKASEVHVNIRKTRKTLVLKISDNGVGLDSTVADRSSLGIVGMRERARLAGGSVEINNRPSGGVQVEARLPLDSSQDNTRKAA